MGRHVGRSKGCLTCRQRKLKCDESVPECSQCLHTGRKCPGALVGSVFIDMSTQLIRRGRTATENDPVDASDRGDISVRPLAIAIQDQPATQSNMQEYTPRTTGSKTKKSGKHMKNSLCDRDDPANSSTILRSNLASKKGPFTIKNFQLPKGYQPSRAELFQQQFMAFFIDFFIHPDPSCSWVRKLSSILVSTSYSPLKCSIRAATMGLYGVLTRNKSIQIEACRWYASALENQRHRVKELSRTLPLDGSTIFVSIMFVSFETVMSTVAGAWTRHAYAAVKLIEMMGPESCQTGCLHTLFRTIRHADTYMSLMWEKPSLLASSEWCDIPFALQDKWPRDKLMDIVAQLPACYARRNQLDSFRNRNLPVSEKAKSGLVSRVADLILRLDDWWRISKNEVDKDYDYAWFSESLDGTPKSHPSRIISCQNTLAATLILLYDQSKIALYSLMEPIFPIQHCFEQRMRLHSASVLAATRYLKTKGGSNSGYATAVLGLRLVYSHSPSECQRKEAQEILVDLERGNSLAPVYEHNPPIRF